MPYTSSSSVQPDFDTGGWSPACEMESSIFINWPGPRAATLLLWTDCRPTNRLDSWAVKIKGTHIDPPIFDFHGEPRVLRDYRKTDFDRIPVRFFQFGKRERRHLSVRRLAEIISSSQKEAGPELWEVLQYEGVRDAFLYACPRLLLDSARHLFMRSVMET